MAPIQQRRPAARRLHRGIAGSPLARIIPFPTPEPQQPALDSAPAPKRGRGRPRKHADNAAKQKAHREQRATDALTKTLVGPTTPLGTDGRWFIKGAPHGMGEYVTGGYDSAKCGEVRAARDRDKRGRRVRPKGAGPISDDTTEIWSNKNEQQFQKSEERFQFANKFRFPKTNKLDEYEKEQILKRFICDNVDMETCKEFCEELEDVAERYWPDYYTIHCALCDARLGVGFWPVESYGFVTNHFDTRHKRALWKAWRDAAPKGPPKTAKGAKGRAVRKCLEDHEQFAKFLATLGDLGVSGVRCEKCRRIIYPMTDARSPYFRNASSNDGKLSTIIELEPKVNSNPIRGEISTSSSGSQPGSISPPKTTESCEEDRPS
jgi:hypothetical protein